MDETSVDVVGGSAGAQRGAAEHNRNHGPTPFVASGRPAPYAAPTTRAIDFPSRAVRDTGTTRADRLAAWQHGPMTLRRATASVRLALAAVIGFAAFVGLAATNDRAAFAQSGVVGFQTPTKNINCTIYTDLSPRTLECMVSTYTGKVPTRPNDCELDWTPQADLGTTGRASLFACRGDTSWWVDAPVLAYGKTFRNGAFTCKSEKTGVTCTNNSKRGFKVSRGSITAF